VAALYHCSNNILSATKLKLSLGLDTKKRLDSRLQNLRDLSNSNCFKADGGGDSTASASLYTFNLSSRNSDKSSIEFTFQDYPGEDHNKKIENVKNYLTECTAVLIAIDSSAMMEEKGRWHEPINHPQQILKLFKETYQDLKLPKLVIFAPVKCETYMSDKKSIDNLYSTTESSYKELIEFFRSPSLSDKVDFVIAPVQTVGSVIFSYIKEIKGEPQFFYRKRNSSDKYQPHGGSILIDQINNAIEASNDNSYGYKVKGFELLNPEELTKGIEKQPSTAILSKRELSYSEQNLEDLAKEIEKSSLPTGKKNLIVVTDNKTQVIVNESQLYLSLGDVVVEQSMSESLKIESDRSTRPSFDLLDFLHRLSPKLALFAVGFIVSGILLCQNIITSRQTIPTINLQKIEVTTVFVGTFNSPEIKKVKLINSDKKEIATGTIGSNNQWTIVYRLEPKINCRNQLSIQGFNEGGKEVGESITIPSLCND
jgi:hypothetical protein